MTLNELLKVLPKNFYFELKGKNKETIIDENSEFIKEHCKGLLKNKVELLDIESEYPIIYLK